MDLEKIEFAVALSQCCELDDEMNVLTCEFCSPFGDAHERDCVVLKADRFVYGIDAKQAYKMLIKQRNFENIREMVGKDIYKFLNVIFTTLA